MAFLAKFTWSLQGIDIIVIVAVIIAAIVAGLYYLNKWAAKKTTEQQQFVDSSKIDATIFVIDKKHDKAANVNLPKAVMTKLPKVYKFMKMYFIQAKVGPQIVTLMCDKKIFNYLAIKKNAKVELAGIYISNVKGMKSDYEKKQAQKRKKAQEKHDKEAAKAAAKEAKKLAKRK